MENHVALAAELGREVRSSMYSLPTQYPGERDLRERERERDIEACNDLLALLIEHHADHKSVLKFLPKTKPEPIPEPVKEVAKVVPPLVVAAPIIPLPVSMPEPAEALQLPSIAIIARETASFYEITLMDINSERRTAKVVRPRQVAMYLAKIMTLRSLPEIGHRFGNRDHTTVLHAVRKIERLVGVDERLADEIEVLKLRILQVVLNQSAALVQ